MFWRGYKSHAKTYKNQERAPFYSFARFAVNGHAPRQRNADLRAPRRRKGTPEKNVALYGERVARIYARRGVRLHRGADGAVVVPQSKL